MAKAAALALALAFAGAAGAHGEATETVIKVPVQAPGAGVVTIDVTVFRPEGKGPFPLAVINHGSPRVAADRRADGRQRFVTQSRELARRGFIVAVPTRRGYGESGGEWAEGFGSCRNPNYYASGLESARDVRAAIAELKRDPDVDPGRVLLLGQSAGGWAALATASQPLEGLVGVINFAGGRGSSRPGEVCDDARLVQDAGRYGATSRVPQLWLYADNDRYFSPDIARRMHESFTRAGGNATLRQLPPFEADGHSLFARGTSEWLPQVEPFLAELGFVAPKD
jgi:dienelactone hydrolase